jgi:hypothetical protein
MIVLWGSNISSQPNTARHIISARRRGAKVIMIDVRRTEAAAQSDEVILIRPGSDAALTLAVMHVIVTEKLYDAAFVGSHTIGFEELSTHILPFTPAWGAEETGVEANQVISFARAYASTRPAMIPARRQFHAQGCQRLACRARDQLSAIVDWRFRASGRWTWPTSWRAERKFAEPERGRKASAGELHSEPNARYRRGFHFRSVRRIMAPRSRLLGAKRLRLWTGHVSSWRHQVCRAELSAPSWIGAVEGVV